MANKRNKGKDQINAWISRDLKAIYVKKAREYGWPVSKVVEMVLRDQAGEYEAKSPSERGHRSGTQGKAEEDR